MRRGIGSSKMMNRTPFILIFFILAASCRQQREANADQTSAEEVKADSGASADPVNDEETALSEALSEIKLYDPERWPMDRAVDSYLAILFLENGKEENLEFHLRDNLWTSIVDLDRYLKQDGLDPRVADFAESTLEGIAAYFKKKPMEPVKPEGPGIAEKIEEASRQKINDLKGQDGAGEVEQELHEGFQELGGVFEGLDEAGRLMRAQRYARYLETKAIVDRINAEE